MDVLTDVLRTLKLQGTVYFQADFREPWGMEIYNTEVANFHVIVSGSCVLEDGDQQLLHEGDIVVFPHGGRHVLKSSETIKPIPAEQLLANPKSLELEKIEFGGNGQVVTLICGHFELQNDLEHPLIRTLPAKIIIRSEDHHDSKWIRTAAELAHRESSHSDGDTSSAIVDRLAEVLLVQVLRAYIQKNQNSLGFLAALSNRNLSRVLEQIHSAPGRRWNLEEMALIAGMSRTVLLTAFREQIGLSPMKYILQWRMQLAHTRLADGEISMAEIADQCGYDSEFSFAKAFKRHFQVSPGVVRRRG